MGLSRWLWLTSWLQSCGVLYNTGSFGLLDKPFVPEAVTWGIWPQKPSGAKSTDRFPARAPTSNVRDTILEPKR